MDDPRSSSHDDDPSPDTDRSARQSDPSISNLVMQEAAAVIEAAGRELTLQESTTVKDFLKGPALKVGLALSVLGVTLWIEELIQEHHAKQRRGAVGAPSRPRTRGRRRSKQTITQ